MTPPSHEHRWGNEMQLRYGTIRHCACGARLLVIDWHEPMITDPRKEAAVRELAHGLSENVGILPGGFFGALLRERR